MFSGGLDSLGMTYKLLTEKEYKIHIHHIHIKNIEQRHLAEAIAVQSALNEFKNLGYKFIFTSSEVSAPHYHNKFMYDTDILNFFAGYLASIDPSIEKIAMGMNIDDNNIRLEDRIKRANNILSAFTDKEKIYPVLNKSKLDIYNSLPNTLKNKFWSCRTPIYTENSIIPCNRCKTCKILIELKIPHENYS